MLDRAADKRSRLGLAFRLRERERVNEEALTVHHSQVLHGLLNFAGGFYSGRGIRHLGSELLELRRLSAAHGSSGLWLQKLKKCCTELRHANFGRTKPKPT